MAAKYQGVHAFTPNFTLHVKNFSEVRHGAGEACVTTRETEESMVSSTRTAEPMSTGPTHNLHFRSSLSHISEH